MTQFDTNKLFASLLLAGFVFGAQSARAVSLSPEGIGQVLLFPYYTTREPAPGNPYVSLLSVANTTPLPKAVRVRFLEGRRGQPVFDLNLFLAPNEQWTAAVQSVGAGAGIASADTSCTLPPMSRDTAAPSAFSGAAFAGDGLGNGLERAREGYLEVIEMGVPSDPAVVAAIARADAPPTCTGLANLAAGAALDPPRGGLAGSMTLASLLAVTEYTAGAIALDAFRRRGHYELPGTPKPDLADVDPPVASLAAGAVAGAGAMEAANWLQPVDAVSALLMKDHVYNDFMVDPITWTGTDWIATMPTKRYYYSNTQVVYLFQRNLGADGACDDVRIEARQRDDAFGDGVPSRERPSGMTRSPPALCWAANVVSFNAANVLGSGNGAVISTAYSRGLVDLQFVPTLGATGAPAHVLLPQPAVGANLANLASLAGPGNVMLAGLPVIGYSVQSYTVGTLDAVLGGASASRFANIFRRPPQAVQDVR